MTTRPMSPRVALTLLGRRWRQVMHPLQRALEELVRIVNIHVDLVKHPDRDHQEIPSRALLEGCANWRVTPRRIPFATEAVDLLLYPWSIKRCVKDVMREPVTNLSNRREVRQTLLADCAHTMCHLDSSAICAEHASGREEPFVTLRVDHKPRLKQRQNRLVEERGRHDERAAIRFLRELPSKYLVLFVGKIVRILQIQCVPSPLFASLACNSTKWGYG